MVETIFKDLIYRTFFYCEKWFTTLIDALGAGGIILAMFFLIFIINVLFMPLRGFGLLPRGGGSSFSSFKNQSKIFQKQAHAPEVEAKSISNTDVSV